MGSRELEGKTTKGGIGFGGDQWDILYLLERVQWVGAAMVTSELLPVGLATSMKQGPTNESVQVAMVGSVWGFGDKTDGIVIDCIQFVE